jgi:hypothetical protein
MKVPSENGEEVRIIAQSHFDVNQENIEGAVPDKRACLSE